MKKIVLLAVAWLFLFGSPAASQTLGNPVISGSIDSQFYHLNRISRTSDGYKLIRTQNLERIRINVLDSIKLYQSESAAKSQEIEDLSSRITVARDSLLEAHQALEELEKRSESTRFLGMQMAETSYHLLVWSINLAMLIILIVLIIRGRQRQITSRDAREALATVQEEYDNFRKKALEKEQKLKRQLQDEINKGHG